MTELDQNLNNDQCYEWGNRDKEGSIVQRDLFFKRNDRIYSITVTTPDYLAVIKARNLQIEDPDLKENEKILVLDDISSVKQICQQLHQAPWEIIQPYVSEQVRSAESSENQAVNIDRLDFGS